MPTLNEVVRHALTAHGVHVDDRQLHSWLKYQGLDDTRLLRIRETVNTPDYDDPRYGLAVPEETHVFRRSSTTP